MLLFFGIVSECGTYALGMAGVVCVCVCVCECVRERERERDEGDNSCSYFILFN